MLTSVSGTCKLVHPRKVLRLWKNKQWRSLDDYVVLQLPCWIKFTLIITLLVTITKANNILLITVSNSYNTFMAIELKQFEQTKNSSKWKEQTRKNIINTHQQLLNEHDKHCVQPNIKLWIRRVKAYMTLYVLVSVLVYSEKVEKKKWRNVSVCGWSHVIPYVIIIII